MKEPVWIEASDVYAFHNEMIARFGGLPGVRDEGLLLSALNRPKNRFAYENPTKFQLAVDYAVGIARNHPFLDGNKRAAFVAAAMFLEINGFVFRAPEEEVVVYTRGLAAGEIEAEDYAAWLERSCSV
jgi:death-on-curing protein